MQPRIIDNDPYPETPETIARAKLANAIERAQIFRDTGLRIRQDGSFQLPKKGPRRVVRAS
jgi:hypothetical protein